MHAPCVDRNDVVGALDAFGEAVESRIDLATVNGRVFVNPYNANELDSIHIPDSHAEHEHTTHP